jgi:hypothetical protein
MGCSDFLDYDKKLNKGFTNDEEKKQNMRLCKFPKFFDSYYNMSNILVAVCAHCDFYVGCVFRLKLSLADLASRLISIQDNIQEILQGEPTTTFMLNVQVIGFCVLSYGSM